MAVKWTDAQQYAITSRGGTVLVSAAAGSGKTAVLVERIIRRIVDKENPCDVDELLVVTFAKDAAAEMRERIYARLGEMIEKNPDDVSLVRQQLILPRAKICTIDSFCGDVVRENATLLGVSRDYKVVTGNQYENYKSVAVKMALDEMYNAMPEGFSNLVELVSSGRSDAALEKTVLAIYQDVNAYPNPEAQLDKMREMYRCEIPAEKTVWGRAIMPYCRSGIEYHIEKYEGIISQMSFDSVYEPYCVFAREEANRLRTVSDNLENMTWDEAVSAISSFEFATLPSVKGMSRDELKKALTAVRKGCKDELKLFSEKYFCVSAEQFDDDRRACLPIVNALVETVKTFIIKLDELMKRDNVLGFSDIQHLAVKLLCDYNGGQYKKTAAAKELSERFSEIFIDEYQDVNAVQHMIFSCVSRDDKNIFMVGDVKQSIYAFRQAMPEIFLGMRNEFSVYDGATYPAKIILDRNFRSGSDVIDTVNFCFRMLMSEQTGGIAYDGEDELVVQDDYEVGKQAEFDIVTLNEELSTDFAEATFIADRIKNIVDSGELVTMKDGSTRPIRYGDFCILLRSAKSHADNYTSVLKSHGINATYELSGDFFSCEEIRMIISLLRVIDNPLLDVDLLSVMFSAFYGFTPDDVAKMRMDYRNSSLYTAVCAFARSGDERCKKFVDDLAAYRVLAGTVTSDELIRRIYKTTSISSICRAMGNSEQRRANLMLLMNYAQGFESNGFRGLSAFIRFMEQLEEGENKVESSFDSASLDNAVRVTTIHKSKGLEFPYCIIAGLGRTFNRQPINFGPITHSKLGVGFNLRDVETLSEYNTVQRAVVRQMIVNDDMAEQLRVLYVAMTRAKEKLILVTSARDPEALIEKCSGMQCGEKIRDFVVYSASNTAELLLYCLLSSPTAKFCRYFSNVSDITEEGTEAFAINVITGVELHTDETETNAESEKIQISAELEKAVRERIEYKYPYMALSKTVSKTTASNLKASALNEEFFASDIPAFMSKGGLTAAQRGTATHRFLQCCDYSCADNLSAEADRLVESGKMTREQADAIDYRLVEKFFESDLYSRISRSSNVQREYNFAVNVSACDLDPELPKEFADELVMVQGAVDCFFEEDGEIVIVDYKTDRIKSEDELRARYTSQLKMYLSAVEQCTEKRVKQCVLYSFTLGRSVEI
ncbi:MAG: helicase-exonuclease AddAB subunit AddA [Clostridia bacterium]|nr:helicase-exonuclease AddAB subunit AddA [Clostridia bacterium]